MPQKLSINRQWQATDRNFNQTPSLLHYKIEDGVENRTLEFTKECYRHPFCSLTTQPQKPFSSVDRLSTYSLIPQIPLFNCQLKTMRTLTSPKHISHLISNQSFNWNEWFNIDGMILCLVHMCEWFYIKEGCDAAYTKVKILFFVMSSFPSVCDCIRKKFFHLLK